MNKDYRQLCLDLGISKLIKLVKIILKHLFTVPPPVNQKDKK